MADSGTQGYVYRSSTVRFLAEQRDAATEARDIALRQLDQAIEERDAAELHAFELETRLADLTYEYEQLRFSYENLLVTTGAVDNLAGHGDAARASTGSVAYAAPCASTESVAPVMPSPMHQSLSVLPHP